MILREIKRGIIDENPIFVIVLGLCPTLAVSTSLENGIGMGLAATFVLIASNVLISMIRKLVPDKIRIPCYIVVIATFVTIIDLLMKAYFPALNRSLGIFVPLIVVNCIILGRAEAYAAKNSVFMSLLDGIGIGLGFTLALCILSIIREILGSNKLLGLLVIPGFEPMPVMGLATGGFFTIALIMGLLAMIRDRRKKA
jgi:electron transport complex protein RnfE